MMLNTTMDPTYWGGGTWIILTLLALQAEDNHRLEPTCIFNVTHTAIDSLPCSMCRGHAQDYWREHPMDPLQPFRYMIEMHNAVNKRLGREQWTLDRAYKHYRSLLKG
jgi:hypothetical protein